MPLRILILAALLAAPATAQTAPTDPAAVMARVMAAFAGIDKTPDQVMDAFLPEAGPKANLIVPVSDLPADVDDPQAIFFATSLPGDDPTGMNGVVLSCVRFGPSTLASANEAGMTVSGMLMGRSQDGWVGKTAEDLPELGSPQTFPEGAVLRQDCLIRFGVPVDMDIQSLKDWPAAAIKAIEGQFGTLTTSEIKGPAPNPRVGLRASDPQGDPMVQIRLMMGVMPYRPFDDTTLPAFGLELRAATYLFGPSS